MTFVDETCVGLAFGKDRSAEIEFLLLNLPVLTSLIAQVRRRCDVQRK